jgi:hypothetical protein
VENLSKVRSPYHLSGACEREDSIDFIFSTPNIALNLEVRNRTGEMALLLACRWVSSPDKTKKHNAEGRSTPNLLILRGADICAWDDHRNNILHLLARKSGAHHGFEDFVPIVKEAPELINQSNNKGITPLS